MSCERTTKSWAET